MAHSYSYTYDPKGNRLTATDNLASTTTTYTYDAANQMVSSEDPSGTTTYEYDGAGNQTKITTPASVVTTNTWDDEGYFSNGTVFVSGGVKIGSCHAGNLFDADGGFLGTFEGDIMGAAASLLLLDKWLREME